MNMTGIYYYDDDDLVLEDLPDHSDDVSLLIHYQIHKLQLSR